MKIPTNLTTKAKENNNNLTILDSNIQIIVTAKPLNQFFDRYTELISIRNLPNP